jgi:hypothetical protein
MPGNNVKRSFKNYQNFQLTPLSAVIEPAFMTLFEPACLPKNVTDDDANLTMFAACPTPRNYSINISETH